MLDPVITEAEVRTVLAVDSRVLTTWRFEEWKIDSLHPLAVAIGPLEDSAPSFRSILPRHAISPHAYDHPPCKFRVLTMRELIEPQK
jgi:hypothetical protein